MPRFLKRRNVGSRSIAFRKAAAASSSLPSPRIHEPEVVVRARIVGHQVHRVAVLLARLCPLAVVQIVRRRAACSRPPVVGRQADRLLQRRLHQLGTSLPVCSSASAPYAAALNLSSRSASSSSWLARSFWSVNAYRHAERHVRRCQVRAPARARATTPRAPARCTSCRAAGRTAGSWHARGPRRPERIARPARRSARAAESPFRAPAAGSSAPASRARACSSPAGRPPAPVRRRVAEPRVLRRQHDQQRVPPRRRDRREDPARRSAAVFAAGDRAPLADPMPIASDSAAIICPAVAKRFRGSALDRRLDDAGERARADRAGRRATFGVCRTRARARSSSKFAALDGVLRRQQIEQQHADRVDVARDRGRLAAQQFRRHVGGRAARESWSVAVFVREPEIHQQDPAALLAHHVAGLDVAVEKSGGVDRAGRPADVDADRAPPPRTRADPASRAVRERLALDEIAPESDAPSCRSTP